MELPKYQQLIQIFFKNRKGFPFIATPGQCEIFKTIFEQSFKRVTITAITRYGKSDVTAMALLLIATSRREKILIVAPSADQASIIMNNVISHIFDHRLFMDMLQMDTSLERLKNERSKERITFRNGSEIFILTSKVERMGDQGLNLMGFGATVIIVDESSLIPDILFSKILRMLGDDAENAKMVQLGNTFEQNHFFKAFQSTNYYKIRIAEEQALKEGRVTQEFLDEMKDIMPPLDYKIFYKCEFPEGGAEDSLIPHDWIDLAVEQHIETEVTDVKRVGIDVARFGPDKSVYICRKGGKVIRLDKKQGMDTMVLVGWFGRNLEEDQPDNGGVDVIGIGSGVYDRLVEIGYDYLDGVNVGSSPSTDTLKERFMNLRAEIFWNLRDRFRPIKGKSMISIPNDPDLIQELKGLRYRYSSDKKIRIEEKDEMKKRMGRSPDTADALALAFMEDEGPQMLIL